MKRIRFIPVIFVLSVFSVLFFGGCGSPYSTRHIGSLKIFESRSVHALNSNKPSRTTRQYLRLAFLDKPYKKDPGTVIEQLLKQAEAEPDLETVQAVSELALLEARRLRSRHPEQATLMYLTAARAAYWYLLKDRSSGSFIALKPSFRYIADVYNAAVTDLLDMHLKEKRFEKKHGEPVESETTIYEFSLDTTAPHTVDPFIFDEIIPAYTLETRGLANEYFSKGLGAPLIGIVDNPSTHPAWGPFYPKSRSAHSLTAIVRFGRAVKKEGKQHVACSLSVYFPLDNDTVEIEGYEIPLEADFSTPLVYQLENVKPLRVGLRGMFQSGKYIEGAGLSMLEPYQPDKIPVVMVHGLMSSPITWVPVFNDLRGDPQLRKHYQFWFFYYPTGLPIGYSASLLRRDLIEIRKMLDPEQVNRNLDNMVLIGHSMGGLLSRLMVQNSGRVYWDSLFEQSPEELPVDEETLDLLKSMAFFEVQPYIKRIVFICTPHRGSDLADKWYSKFGASLIKLPENLTGSIHAIFSDESIQLNEQAFRKTKKIYSSIELLSPTSPFMEVQLRVPLREDIPYHSIIGIRDAEQGPGSSDGVVPYWSSHLDFAVSEKLVPSDHGSHHHPIAIEELKRILRVNLEEMK